MRQTSTATDIKRVAAFKWDVDIDEPTAESWLPEVQSLVEAARKRWGNERRWAGKYRKSTGIDHGDEDGEEFDADSVIERFLRQKLGRPAYFDTEDRFVPSEYLQKVGKTYRGELNKLNEGTSHGQEK